MFLTPKGACVVAFTTNFTFSIGDAKVGISLVLFLLKRRELNVQSNLNIVTLVYKTPFYYLKTLKPKFLV